MGADTIVEVGTDPAAKQEYLTLQKKAEELDLGVKEQIPIIDNFKAKMARGANVSKEQMLYIKGVMQKKEALEKELAEVNARMEALSEKLQENRLAQVICYGEVFAGTKICIGDVSMTAKGGTKYCRFVKEAGDVKVTGI